MAIDCDLGYRIAKGAEEGCLRALDYLASIEGPEAELAERLWGSWSDLHDGVVADIDVWERRCSLRVI